MQIHIVTAADSIYSLSKQYSIPESRIIRDNCLDPTKKLSAGQALIISHPSKTCTVKGGDTISSIASNNSVSVMSLMQNNPELICDSLTPSQTLNIKYEKNTSKSIVVSAYSGNAAANAVKNLLPYISMLHIQNAAYISGKKISLLKNSAPLVSLANEFSALPILTLDCADESGISKSDFWEAVLESPSTTEEFIKSTLSTVKNGGFGGLEMQLGFYEEALEYKLLEVMTALAGVFEENGYKFILPYLPFSENDGLSLEQCDISDFIPVWNYIWDDETIASPAAPLNKIVATLNSESLQRYCGKALLGVPTFGTEYVKAASGYRKQTTDAAEGLRLMQRYPISAKFDEQSATPFLVYNENMRSSDIAHTLYFEDARSYCEKLDLVEKYGLAGINVMSLEYSAPVFWKILNQRFEIVKF